MELHICAKFYHVTRSQSHFIPFTKKKADKSKMTKFGPKFWHEGIRIIQNPAIMLNNFIIPFRNWKQNAKILSRSKVIEIWKNVPFFPIFYVFSTFFNFSDDVSKKWQPLWKIFFCHFVGITPSNNCTKFHVHSFIHSRDLRGGSNRPPPVNLTSKKPGSDRVNKKFIQE